jgi:RNA polymerase sigma factor (sigma-70 family)
MMVMAGARPNMDELLQHADWVRRLARILVRDESLADDLVQDTWVAALRSPPRPGEPPRPWLAEVLRNALRMRRRGDGRRLRREDAVASRAARDDGGARLVEALEAQRQLAEALSNLPEPWRSTLLWHYYEGLSAVEIAARQKVPAATVRGRLKDGRERLRAQLDRAPGGRAAWLGSFTALANRPVLATAKVAGGVKGALLMKVAVQTGIALVVVGGALTLMRHRSQDEARHEAAMSTTAATTATREPAPLRTSATTTALEAVTTTAAPGKLSPQMRAEMLQRLAALHLGPGAATTSHGAPAPTPNSSDGDDGLDKSYIREQVQQILPLLKECYDSALKRHPTISGKLMVDFSIVGDPSVGGLVGDSQINRAHSDIVDDDMAECVKETMYAAQFKPPASGGEVKVSYPFVFSPDGPPPGDDNPASKKN